MANIHDAIKSITGKDPSQTEVQKIAAIAHALDITAQDPMLSILIVLDVYHGVFSKLPERMNDAANNAANGAANRAEKNVDEAVAKAISKLAPAVERGIEKSAKEVIDRVTMSMSLSNLAFATTAVAVVVILSFMAGTGVLTRYAQGGFTGFWEAVNAGVEVAATLVVSSLLATFFASHKKYWLAGLAGAVFIFVLSFAVLSKFC